MNYRPRVATRLFPVLHAAGVVQAHLESKLDALLGLHLQGAFWGAGAVLVGAAGAAIQIGGRRRAQTPQAVAA